MARIDDILTEIRNGVHDGWMETLTDAVASRKRKLGMKLAMELKSGDVVRVRDNVRPKYLRGVTFVVKSISGEKIVGDREFPDGRKFDKNVRFKPSMVMKV